MSFIGLPEGDNLDWKRQCICRTCVKTLQSFASRQRLCCYSGSPCPQYTWTKSQPLSPCHGPPSVAVGVVNSIRMLEMNFVFSHRQSLKSIGPQTVFQVLLCQRLGTASFLWCVSCFETLQLHTHTYNHHHTSYNIQQAYV